jgi:D-alanyl-D-alanine carboxypeptidase-like protein
MTRVTGSLGAAIAGAVLGAALTLSLTAPAGQEEVAVPDAPRNPIVGDAPVPTLLAWSPGGLPPGYASAVESLDEVRSTVTVRSGVAWLSAWRDREGALRTPPKDLSIPMEIAAADMKDYLAFVPPVERAEFAALSGGAALMGRTGAAIRGVGPGGSVRFGATTLAVRAVVDDELIGAHEILVSLRTGEKLGISVPRYLLVAPRQGARPQAVEAALRRVLPAGTRLRVRAPGETPVFRHGDAVLPPVRLKELFGEFAGAPRSDGTIRTDPAWVRTNIRRIRLPILGRTSCHRLLIPQLRAALQELARRGLGDLLDPGDFGGCFFPRFANLNTRSGISHHSWGVAVDLNVSQNPLGGEPRLDRRVVDVFERWGFTWGGRWLLPDPMHLEFLRFPLATKG